MMFWKTELNLSDLLLYRETHCLGQKVEELRGIVRNCEASALLA
jgi:hypothetical protein